MRCAAVCAILLAACGPVPTPEAPLEPDHLGFRRVEVAGCSIAVPSSWVNATAPGSETVLAHFVDPAGNGFHANVNIAREAYSGSLDAFVEDNLQAIASEARVLGRVPASVAGYPAFVIESDWSRNGSEIRSLQLLSVVAGARGYVITCMAGSSEFEQLRPLCEEMFRTIDLQ